MYAGRSGLPDSSHASMRTTQRACGTFWSASAARAMVLAKAA